MTQLSRFFAFSILLFCSLVLFGLLTYDQPGPSEVDKIVIIEPGSSLSKIANSLEQEKIVANAFLFKVYATLIGDERSLKSGEFVFVKQGSYKQVIAKLASGDTVTRSMTFPEGLSSAQISAMINLEAGLKGDFVDLPGEGTLLPETYYYKYGDHKQAMIKRLEHALAKLIKDEWSSRAENLPYATPYEALIMASIIEKETALPDEVYKVAGVFVNRLKKKMPLQADPTVLYALTLGQKELGRELLKKDLEIDSPFNTYKIRGLPLTPICNPGARAIKAALHPEAHDYLYFVVDGKGGHIFAKTLKDHEKNVKNWRKYKKELSAVATAAAR